MKVLYATDGGLPSLEALALLERVGSPAKVSVTVVTVGRAETSAGSADLCAAEIMSSAVARLIKAGFAVDQRLLSGNPSEAILEEINDGAFDLTVVGAGNHTRLGRLLMGSVSTRLLHASPTSLMIVHRFTDVKPSIRILFATDGSRHAGLALDRMISFAEPASCEVRVFSVAEHPIPVIGFPPREALALSAPTPEQEEEWLAPAVRIATGAAKRLEAAGFKSSARARLGARIPRVLDELDEFNADLVVVGTAGLGSLQRTILGSVSDQVVRHASASLVARG